MSKFPVVECVECQALSDAQLMLDQIEAIARRERMDPERMLFALLELHSLWAAVTIESLPELDIEPEALCQSFRDSLQQRLDAGREHTH